MSGWTDCRQRRDLTSCDCHTFRVEDPICAEGPVVLLRGGDDLRRQLLLRDPVYTSGEGIHRRYGDESVRCVAEVRDRGLEARVTLRTWRDDGLAQFLRGLSDHFAGWAGSRHWQSANEQIQIEATHDGRGHVTLLIRLRDWSYRPEGWDVGVPFAVEAGAEMSSLADAVEAFFAAASFHSDVDD